METSLSRHCVSTGYSIYRDSVITDFSKLERWDQLISILFDISYDKPPNPGSVPASRLTILRIDEMRCVRTDHMRVIPPPPHFPRLRYQLLSDVVLISLFVIIESNLSGQWIHWKLPIIHVLALFPERTGGICVSCNITKGTALD
jgi:hypothetical protein